MDRSRLVPKTSAKTLYCLSEKELDGLAPIEKPNPRARSGPPMKLYGKEQLERLATQRWGSLAGLEAERAKRQQKREQRSILSYMQKQGAAASGGGEGEQAEVGSGVGAASGAAAASGGIGEGGSTASPPTSSGGLPPADWRAGLRHPLASRIHMVRPGQQQLQEQQFEGGTPRGGGGRYVLYWMKTAVRVHENPALDVAAHASRQLGLPLVVASFLLASHPYATARRWKFLLEGLRDVQVELRTQGGELLVYLEGQTEPGGQVVAPPVPYTGQPHDCEGARPAAPSSSSTGQAQPQLLQASRFHPPPGFQQSVGWRRLVQLAEGAAVVVAEDMPVPPHHDWLQALAVQLPPYVQLCAVDAACILPMRTVGRSFDRAYAFCAATASRRQASAAATYSLQLGSSVVGPAALAPVQLSGAAQQSREALLSLLCLPWAPLDLAVLPDEGLHGALCALVAACGDPIDQSVPPVPHTVGGWRAGYARWEDFRRRGLPLYAARRNDALQRNGVSRLSAYHHWGMVSPFKLAREAGLDKSGGASKYLDEFLTWRELSYLYCLHHTPHLHTLAALPKWAQQTLARHAADPRDVKSLAELEAGRTGDAFWDAAQFQLVTTGELHNNVRMTWGKAVLPWCATPLQALQLALHLNHKYALDGCDPASYSGVLWCFGCFDGPKASEATPISGSLATRPTSRHARRLSPAVYRSLPC